MSVQGHSRRFWHVRDVRLRDNLGSTGPPVLPVEGIGLNVIQAPKPEPLAFVKLASIRIWLRADESTRGSRSQDSHHFDKC